MADRVASTADRIQELEDNDPVWRWRLALDLGFETDLASLLRPIRPCDLALPAGSGEMAAR